MAGILLMLLAAPDPARGQGARRGADHFARLHPAALAPTARWASARSLLHTRPDLPVGIGFAPDDTLASVQSDDGFNSLEDGQPGEPGELELQPDLAGQDLPGPEDMAQAVVELQYTLPWKGLHDMQLQLTANAVTGDGGGELGDLTAAWQHRWLADPRSMVTVATLLEVDLPIGESSSGLDATLTGIAVGSFGPGSVYWNGFLEADEQGLDGWGLRLGYKFPLTQSAALIADYVLHAEDGGPARSIAELSADWDVNDRLSIGPGILIGLDGARDTPRFGAGIRAVLSLSGGPPG